MLDCGQRPLINVEFKVLKNSGSLAALPFSEVQQGLAFASVWVFASHPGSYLLRQDLVHPERSACSLSVEALSAPVVEMRVIHVQPFPDTALPIMFRNRN
jgi:hypothetical protein